MIKAAELLQRAQAATSLDDYGDDSFREGLELLVASIETEARLSESGRTAYYGQLVDFLSNRLQVEHWYRLHPEIDEQEIVAPLIGLGLPRTGSTALSCMLAEDPAVRSIRNWEAQAPCPPPETATQYSDPRIAKAEQAMERRNRMFPRMKTMVPSTTTVADRMPDVHGLRFQVAVVPGVRAGSELCRVAQPQGRSRHRRIAIVKRVLKLLQWRCPPTRWRLKNPSHSLFIDALAKVFPDARFWMTHRDVANVIPSVADLYYELTKAFSDDVDKKWLGSMTTDFCELGMRRMMAFRDAGNEHRFFDIYFKPFQKDPFPILAQLYAFLGEDLTPVARERMEAWRRDTPRDKHGSHSYDTAEFGIDPVELRRRFAFYSSRYADEIS